MPGSRWFKYKSWISSPHPSWISSDPQHHPSAVDLGRSRPSPPSPRHPMSSPLLTQDLRRSRQKPESHQKVGEFRVGQLVSWAHLMGTRDQVSGFGGREWRWASVWVCLTRRAERRTHGAGEGVCNYRLDMMLCGSVWEFLSE